MVHVPLSIVGLADIATPSSNVSNHTSTATVHAPSTWTYEWLHFLCVCFSARFKGTEERAGMLVEYVCDRRIGTEQQLTGE